LVTLWVEIHPCDAVVASALGEMLGGGWLTSKSEATVVDVVGVVATPDEQNWRKSEYVDPVGVST
jgi:hypothetical protein